MLHAPEHPVQSAWGTVPAPVYLEEVTLMPMVYTALVLILLKWQAPSGASFSILFLLH